MRIEKEQTVAIGIDYQEKLVPVMHKKEKLIENSRILLSGLSTLEVPICLTQQYTKGLGETVPEIIAQRGSRNMWRKSASAPMRISKSLSKENGLSFSAALRRTSVCFRR